MHRDALKNLVLITMKFFHSWQSITQFVQHTRCKNSIPKWRFWRTNICEATGRLHRQKVIRTWFLSCRKAFMVWSNLHMLEQDHGWVFQGTGIHAKRCWSLYLPQMSHKGQSKCILFIAVYVNDLLIASNDTDTLLLKKKRLGEHFKMEDEGEVHYVLGMSVMWNRKEKLLTIDQHTFLSSVLERFGMENCKPVATLL